MTGRHEHRHQHQRGDGVAAPPGLVDREGDRDPEGHLEADGQHEVDDRADPARPDRAVAEQAVQLSRPPIRSEIPPIIRTSEKLIDDDVDEREDRDQREDEQRRRQHLALEGARAAAADGGGPRRRRCSRSVVTAITAPQGRGAFDRAFEAVLGVAHALLGGLRPGEHLRQLGEDDGVALVPRGDLRSGRCCPAARPRTRRPSSSTFGISGGAPPRPPAGDRIDSRRRPAADLALEVGQPRLRRVAQLTNSHAALLLALRRDAVDADPRAAVHVRAALRSRAGAA